VKNVPTLLNNLPTLYAEHFD